MATSDIIEHFSTDKANRDLTNLISTLVGVGVKAIIGTVLTTLITSVVLIFSVGASTPFLAVLGIGFIVRFLVDSLDCYYLNFTGGIKYLLI